MFLKLFNLLLQNSGFYNTVTFFSKQKKDSSITLKTKVQTVTNNLDLAIIPTFKLSLRKGKMRQVWWCMAVMPALGVQRQED